MYEYTKTLAPRVATGHPMQTRLEEKNGDRKHHNLMGSMNLAFSLVSSALVFRPMVSNTGSESVCFANQMHNHVLVKYPTYYCFALILPTDTLPEVQTVPS